MSIFFDPLFSRGAGFEKPREGRDWFSRVCWGPGLFSSQTQRVPTTPGFQDLPPELQGLARTQARFLTGEVGKPAPAYPYAIAAGLSPTERMALPVGTALSLGNLSTAGPTAGQIGATLSGAYLGGADPYVKRIVDAMNLRRQQDLSTLRSQYGNIGLANSEALARAEGQLGTQYAGAEGDIRLRAYEAERARQLQAVPFGMALPENAMNMLFRSGALEREIQQNMLTAAYQDWLRQEAGRFRGVGAASPLVSLAFQPQRFENVTQPSLFSQLLSGASAAAELGAFL